MTIKAGERDMGLAVGAEKLASTCLLTSNSAQFGTLRVTPSSRTYATATTNSESMPANSSSCR